MSDETTPPTELTTFILAEVQRQTSEDALRKIVETKIGESVKSAVEAAFRSYGHVGQQIEKAVKNSLSIGDAVDVPSYGSMVLALLRAKMDEVLHDQIKEHLDAEMTEILKIAPKEVTLKDVVEKLISDIDVGERHGSSITLIAEPSDNVDGYWHIYIDEDEDKRKYDCETRIAVDREGKIYSLTINNKDPKGTIIMGSFFGYQKMVFSAYCCGSKFIVGEPSHISTGIGDY